MAESVESITDDEGVTLSWYCTDCGEELGVDPAAPTDRFGEVSCCTNCGSANVAWETWNVETDPTYPHEILNPEPDVAEEADRGSEEA